MREGFIFRAESLVSALASNTTESRKYIELCKSNIEKAVNDDGDTPLMLAIRNKNHAAVIYLISIGANINAVNKHGERPIMLAVGTQLELFGLLKKADLTVVDKDGNTPLLLALIKGRIDIAKFLIEDNLRQLPHIINASNTSGYSTLMVAIEHNYTELFEVLAKESNDENKTKALKLAIRLDRWEAAKLLIRNPSDALMMAAEYGSKDICDRLIYWHRLNVNSPDLTTPPLLLAAGNNNLGMVRYLINEARADINIADKDGNTAAMMATKNGHLDIVQVLFKCPGIKDIGNIFKPAVEAGQKEIVNYLIDIHRRSPVEQINIENINKIVIESASTGNTKALEVLFDCGLTNFKVTDEKGNTPLLLAIGNGHEDTAKFLINKMDDFSASNHERFDALMMAAYFDRVELLDMLIKKKGDSSRDWVIHAYNKALKNNSKNVILYLIDKESYAKEINDRSLLNHAERGDTKKCEFLIEASANIDAINTHGYNALMLAIKNGHKDTAKFLISKMSVLKAKNSAGYTALMMAAKKGYIDILTDILIDKEVEAEDEYQALILASENKDVAMVRILIESLNRRGFDFFTRAADEGEEEVLKTLIDNSLVDIGYINSDRKSTLLIAAEHGFTKLFEPLLLKGAEKKDIYKGLLLAARAGRRGVVARLFMEKWIDAALANRALTTFASNGETEACEIMTRCTAANVNIVDDYSGYNLLMRAIGAGSIDTVKFFLAKGVNINAKNKDGNTALMLAILSRQNDMVKILIAEGADINIPNKNGDAAINIADQNSNPEIVEILRAAGATATTETSLARAAFMGHEHVVSRLIREGEDVDAADENGNTPLILAAKDDKHWIIDILLQNGADIDAKNNHKEKAIDVAARNGKISMVEFLERKMRSPTSLYSSFNIADHNESGYTPFMMAASDGNIEACRNICHDFVAHYAYNLGDKENGNTALMLAVRNNNIEVVRFFLDELKDHINVNVKNKFGETALMLAAGNGNVDICRLLLENVADINATDLSGQTALMVAALNDQAEVVSFLVENGADVNILDRYGNTALQLATNVCSEGSLNVLTREPSGTVSHPSSPIATRTRA